MIFKKNCFLIAVLMCLAGSASAYIGSRDFTDNFDGPAMTNWDQYAPGAYNGAGQYVLTDAEGILRYIDEGAYAATLDVTDIDLATGNFAAGDAGYFSVLLHDGGYRLQVSIVNANDGTGDHMAFLGDRGAGYELWSNHSVGNLSSLSLKYAWDPAANTISVWAAVNGGAMTLYVDNQISYAGGSGAMLEQIYAAEYYTSGNNTPGSPSFALDNYSIALPMSLPASNPTPGDQEVVLSNEITLSWDAGAGAISHNIYFGTDCDSVNTAGATFLSGDLDENGQLDLNDILILCEVWLQDPIGQQPSPDINGDNTVDLNDLAISSLDWHEQSEYKGNQTETSYGPLTLEPDDYCWRVDEVDTGAGVAKGQVWDFAVKERPENINLASQWKFKTDPSNIGTTDLWYGVGYNDSSWALLNVPQSWESQGQSHNGYAWYRKSVFMPDEWDGVTCYLILGGVDDEYYVYINGQYVAHHGGGGQSVYRTLTATEISSYITTNSNNLIAIRVYDWGGNGGIVQSPAIISVNANDHLSLNGFFARGDLTSEEQILKDVIFSANVPVWYNNVGSEGGLLPPPRIFGFVADQQYCQQYAPVLRNNVNHSNPEVRVAVALRLAELRGGEGFEVLLDALKAETNQSARGSDKWLFQFPGIADRLIAMIGHPDGYDPAGSKELRDAVIEKWRTRWNNEGQSWLRGLQKAQDYSPVAGTQKLELQGSTVKTKSMTDMETFFALSSTKITNFATMDGRFSPAGMLLGDLAGIWSQPVKVMDGFEFNIKESGYADWKLLDCDDFVQKLHSCEFNFNKNGLSITRTDFAAEDEPGYFTVLTLNNDTTQARTIEVEFSGRVNLRPGWYSAWSNDLDILSYDSANFIIQAYDKGSPGWATVFGSDQTPVAHDMAANRGILTYSLEIPANGSSEIAFLIVGEHTLGVSAARQKFNSLKSQRSALWTQRENTYQRKLFDDFAFTCSNADVTNAFASAKGTLMIITADCRPYQPGKTFLSAYASYPNPYPADISYAVYGAAAGGLWDAAKGNLETIAYHAQRQSGRVPHSINNEGSRYAGFGNSQETQLYVAACGRYFDWTGDEQFASDYYNQLKQSVNWVLNSIDSDGDHYPEGYSWVESLGVNGENIDSACYLYKAFDVMANLADFLGKTSDASMYSSYAADMKTRFNTDFWNSSQLMWADGLLPAHQMLGYFGVNMPQEIAIADPDKALVVLNKRGGHAWNAYDCIVAIGAYNYGNYKLGWDRLIKGALIPMSNLMLGGFENFYPGGDDGPFDTGAGRYIQTVVEGLCGVSPDAVNHKVEIFPQAPAVLDDFSLTDFYVGQHKLDLNWTREPGGDIEIVVLHESGPVAMDVKLRVRSLGQTIKLNGGIINPADEVIRGITVKPIDISLGPGESAVVRLE